MGRGFDPIRTQVCIYHRRSKTVKLREVYINQLSKTCQLVVKTYTAGCLESSHCYMQFKVSKLVQYIVKLCTADGARKVHLYVLLHWRVFQYMHDESTFWDIFLFLPYPMISIASRDYENVHQILHSKISSVLKIWTNTDTLTLIIEEGSNKQYGNLCIQDMCRAFLQQTP